MAFLCNSNKPTSGRREDLDQFRGCVSRLKAPRSSLAVLHSIHVTTDQKVSPHLDDCAIRVGTEACVGPSVVRMNKNRSTTNCKRELQTEPCMPCRCQPLSCISDRPGHTQAQRSLDRYK